MLSGYWQALSRTDEPRVWENKANKMVCPLTNLHTTAFACEFSVLANKYVLLTCLCSPEDPDLNSLQAALDLLFTCGSHVPGILLIRSITVLTTQWPTHSEVTVGLGCFHLRMIISPHCIEA